MHIKNLKIKLLMYFIAPIIVYSCNPNSKISFDKRAQKIIECNGNGISELWLQNDSVNLKGLSVEDDIIITWTHNSNPPNSLAFNRMPVGYLVNEKVVNNLVLMKNTSYSVATHHPGATYFKIKIWTNKNGKVFKTSHPDCSFNESL